MAFSLNNLASDFAQGIASFFGLDSVVGDLLGDKQSTKEAKRVLDLLNAKLEKLQRQDEDEYNRLMNNLGIVQKSKVFGGSNTSKSLKSANKKREEISKQRNEVNSLVRQVEADLADPKASSRFKYNPKYKDVFSKKGDNPTSKAQSDDYDKERSDLMNRIENAAWI